MGYDAKKAEVFNQLIQAGVSQQQALAQAGIENADIGNYVLGNNSQLGALITGTAPTSTTDGVPNAAYAVRAEDPQSALQAATARPVNTGNPPLAEQLANLRAAQIAANGGVDPNAITDPAVQAQVDRLTALNARQEALRNNPGEQSPQEDPNLPQPEADVNEPPTLTADDVPPLDPGVAAQLEFEQEQNRALLEAENYQPEPVNPDDDPNVRALDEASRAEAEARFNDQNTPDNEAALQASLQAAAKQRAQEQATLNARYRTSANNDWRVKLSLAPQSQYLYNAPQPGILAPLAKSKGVVFPYTPTITTAYSANYETYDLIHSNYRGIYYKNSRVSDVSIRGIFTAQDTKEAEYLLAVIHFFRSITKMFYGQDPERGTPPPLVYLSGFGEFQFNGHPCVVSQFNYTLPNEVDYIKANNPNNYGTSLFNARQPVQSNWGGSSLAGARRLANALLSFGAQPSKPAPPNVAQTVNNTMDSTYVPTKMEIDITLIPVQTRNQVSKVFSLKDFANGNQLKGGFW